MVQELHQAGVPVDRLAEVLPRSRFLDVDGDLTGDDLIAAFLTRYPKAHNRLGRWFVNSPLHEDGRTWVLSNQWGATTVPTLDALAALGPPGAFAYEPA